MEFFQNHAGNAQINKEWKRYKRLGDRAAYHSQSGVPGIGPNEEVSSVEPMRRIIASLLVLCGTMAALIPSVHAMSDVPSFAETEIEAQYQAFWERIWAEDLQTAVEWEAMRAEDPETQDAGDIILIGPYQGWGTPKYRQESASGRTYDLIKWVALRVAGTFWKYAGDVVDLLSFAFDVEVHRPSPTQAQSYLSYLYWYKEGQFQDNRGRWRRGVLVEGRETHASGWSSFWGTDGRQYADWHNGGVSEVVDRENGCHWEDWTWISDVTHLVAQGVWPPQSEAYNGCVRWRP